MVQIYGKQISIYVDVEHFFPGIIKRFLNSFWYEIWLRI